LLFSSLASKQLFARIICREPMSCLLRFLMVLAGRKNFR